MFFMRSCMQLWWVQKALVLEELGEVLGETWKPCWTAVLNRVLVMYVLLHQCMPCAGAGNCGGHQGRCDRGGGHWSAERPGGDAGPQSAPHIGRQGGIKVAIAQIAGCSHYR